MKKKMSIFVLLVLLLLQSPLFAQQKLRSLQTDRRIKVVAYQPNNVVQIHSTTFITTQILLANNESVEDIQGGDIAAWVITVPKYLRNMLFIKPTVLGSNTNITVITDRHTYYFHLMSNQQPTDNPLLQTYAVKFIYPEDEKNQQLKKTNFEKHQDEALLNVERHPKAYNWDYSFSGSKSIMPLHVFDDGQFTYMELQSHQVVPAVFVVEDASGKESVVNFREKNHCLIIQRLAPQFTLRNGNSAVVSIFNNKAIQQLRQDA
ncbi:MAG: TrbG/VirB9 family P-type conjugative transfer protein [Pseudomonadota bacterium]|nr:TrbG/VirB9 family P-type conjugative transfer protein [Gammaproteobacteria bacterium]MBU1927081.1 TrbG/VirB9 family P-type conjugative transfer protein [Gammaproteobacteria bacterium]MBU2546279.1 TrbG/VirB9 family P-type conjugative transfer protein [Gammaproteobacteria bacterium]